MFDDNNENKNKHNDIETWRNDQKEQQKRRKINMKNWEDFRYWKHHWL